MLQASSCRPACSWRSRRRALPCVSGCEVACLVASHVSDVSRLRNLHHCLASVALQDEPCEALYLSWSAASPELAAEVEDMLHRHSLPGRFRHLRQHSRLSQYQHLRACYTACLSELPSSPASFWLTFSDDDDLWHPARIRTFRALCNAQPPHTAALTVGVYAYPLDGATLDPTTAAAVQRALDAREAAVWEGPAEVFQFAVRNQVLSRFLATEPESTLRHRWAALCLGKLLPDHTFVSRLRFCDVRFAQFVRQQACGSLGKVHDVEVEELHRLAGLKLSEMQIEVLLLVLTIMSSRQLSQTERMTSLADLQAGCTIRMVVPVPVLTSGVAAFQAFGNASSGSNSETNDHYERTSTGLSVKTIDHRAALELSVRSQHRACQRLSA
ncbi:MAG: hypothetical protein SGPRY_007260 [Prymnesium sp.]